MGGRGDTQCLWFLVTVTHEVSVDYFKFLTFQIIPWDRQRNSDYPRDTIFVLETDWDSRKYMDKTITQCKLRSLFKILIQTKRYAFRKLEKYYRNLKRDLVGSFHWNYFVKNYCISSTIIETLMYTVYKWVYLLKSYVKIGT